MKFLWAGVWMLCGFVAVEAMAQQGFESAPEGLTGRGIAERVEDIFRGNTSYMEATMTITSPRLPEPRRVKFQAWDDRPEKRSFIRILGPPKDKGMGFLKLHPNMWNYIPRVERTLRIPPSMMLQSWMGSDFSNDDLVRESSQLDDYDHELLGIDPDGGGARAYVLQYVPHEDAPVVWGKILTWVDVERSAPLRQDFFDEGGEKLREMRFSDIREVSGRPYPHHWSMVPLEKKGHETAIEIHEIRFNEEFADAIFTKRHLTKGGGR
ncbi:MAG: outer membrane lipoprotein-sorting protein [bacterium]|nr:outer membrane lipoprotein-sorting protein [bacterium]MCP5070073.1 outer membrane lipoprotein-sorting protein [bacterium]